MVIDGKWEKYNQKKNTNENCREQGNNKKYTTDITATKTDAAWNNAENWKEFSPSLFMVCTYLFAKLLKSLLKVKMYIIVLH